MNLLLSANPYISSSGIVTVYLLLIVFAVLAFLVIVLSIGHKVMQAIQKKREVVKQARAAKKAQQLSASEPVVALSAAGDSEDEAEIVAAITAAISIILQSEAPNKKAKFVVRKIERL